MIPDEPALTRITMIGMNLSKLVEWSSRQFLGERVGSNYENYLHELENPSRNILRKLFQ